MLFLGLGTGLGSALIVDGIVEPMELGHLPYREGTYEDYVGLRGLRRSRAKGSGASGSRTWSSVSSRRSNPTTSCSAAATSNCCNELPPGCRAGDNANAFVGGFRAWELAHRRRGGEVAPNRPAKKRPAARSQAIGSAGVPLSRLSSVPPGRRSEITTRRSRPAFAPALRRRSAPRRAHGARSRRRLSRLLEEPHHRRNRQAARCNWPKNRACASASMRCSAARRSTSPRSARCCTSRCARRATRRSSSTARTSCPTFTRCSTRWRRSPSACAAARGRATPASAFATSSTSASAAPTSAR